MIKLTAPEGKKLRHIPTNNLYSEVVCSEKKASQYVLADSEDDPITQTLEGATLTERVADLEDAVVELAGIIAEV